MDLHVHSMNKCCWTYLREHQTFLCFSNTYLRVLLHVQYLLYKLFIDLICLIVLYKNKSDLWTCTLLHKDMNDGPTIYECLMYFYKIHDADSKPTKDVHTSRREDH